MTNGNIAHAQQFFHFIIILINTCQLFVTKCPACHKSCWLFCGELLGASYNISPKSINNNNKFRQWKQIKNKFWISKLYGCMFPGSLHCTQTKTDGNAPCFTNYSFVFQNASLTNHSGMNKLSGKIITIIHSEYFKW